MRFVLLLTLFGCSGGEPVPPIEVNDIVGYWTGDWGDMVLAEGDDGLVVGAYSHDEGTLSGTLDADALLTGWWCEAPSREPDSDAGAVEFQFIDGGATLDGRWRYGADGEWSDDWDLDKVEGDAPAELTARLEDPEAACLEP